MLINDKVKLIKIARKCTKTPLAISFFESSCYERCVRSCYILGKIPVNTGTLLKKIRFKAFLAILFRV